jgi:diguanylate cyclase (GGDEF)-like protein
MSDGLAMFDRDGHLVYCNDRYRGLFPLTSDIRQPGAHIRDILREVVATGEQLDLGDPEKWIDSIAQSLRVEGEEQVNLHDGRWLQVRTRPTADGASMVVVSDITTVKRSEGELRTLTHQLRTLATTDGLTGLMNRRAFDGLLEDEVARTTGDHSHLSLVMFDVDRFKAYNDCYGHPAGDQCLKEVSRCLTSALLRQRDAAARFGGEEFAVVLPDTDEDSAFVVAERVRQALAELEVPHIMSEHGVVTLSAGIATYNDDTERRSAAQLIARADEALYQAKEAGRNRVMGWQKRHYDRAPAHPDRAGSKTSWRG